MDILTTDQSHRNKLPESAKRCLMGLCCLLSGFICGLILGLILGSSWRQP